MITLIDNALDPDSHCRMVSCHFDQHDFDRETLPEIERRWNVTLPEKLYGAVNKRKAEFIAGRYCANMAIGLLPAVDRTGFTDIHIGEKRQPLWPRGITGSITHSHGFAAAIAADTNNIRSIGIDSEHIVNLKTAENVASHILTTEESFEANRDVAADSESYLTLIFSAKESIFKCLHPLVLEYFDFKDAVIQLSADTPNRFYFELQKTLTTEFCKGYQGEGIFQTVGDFVHTAVLLKP